jgi:hypothetical protein
LAERLTVFKEEESHNLYTDEEEGGGVSIDDTSGSSSRVMHVLRIVYTLMSYTHLQLLLPLLLPLLLLLLLLRLHLPRLPRLCLLPHLRCLPRMCLLLPPLLLLMQVGYNRLGRRKSDRRNRNGGDSKRN